MQVEQMTQAEFWAVLKNPDRLERWILANVSAVGESVAPLKKFLGAFSAIKTLWHVVGIVGLRCSCGAEILTERGGSFSDLNWTSEILRCVATHLREAQGIHVVQS